MHSAKAAKDSMARKRIHELAKEWGVQAQEILAQLEKIGSKGKRAQSSLTEEEVEKVKARLGLTSAPMVGKERLVSERVITEREEGAARVVIAKEQVVESRVRADVIRRRTTRVEVLREPVAVPEEKPGEAGGAAPEITRPFEVTPSFELLPAAEAQAEPTVEVARPSRILGRIDLKVGDVLEVFELEQVTRRLEPKRQEAELRLSA